MKTYDLLVIDLFCGAGGTSTGVHLSRYKEKYPGVISLCFAIMAPCMQTKFKIETK